ncbi:hypothetical protein HDU97_007768 [Phlyctochytrium planicorne]|nr:hypothetical protein HDU97_007768 [Phlyctochytrium planicorne]
MPSTTALAVEFADPSGDNISARTSSSTAYVDPVYAGAIKKPVKLTAGASVEHSHFSLLLKVHGHPSTGVDDKGKRTWLKPSRPVVVDDDFRLAQFKFNLNRLVEAYPVQWVPGCRKARLAYEIERRARDAHGNLYNADDSIELIRLRWKDLSLSLPFNSAINLVAKENYTNFLNEDSTTRNLAIEKELASDPDRAHNPQYHVRWQDWYVVFSDSSMLTYCHTDRFASEEIAAVEHLILGNVKEALNDLSSHGILSEPPSFGRWFSGAGYARRYQRTTGNFAGYNPLEVNDQNFYVPKDKYKEDFRHEVVAPATRDQAHRPTPYLLLDVPLVCKINPGKYYGGGFKENGQEACDFIINNMKVYKPFTTSAGINDGYKPIDELTSIQDASLVHRKRVTNNCVLMSSLDQLFNPLRARIGPYTVYQIRFIFRTAYTAFNGLMETSRKQSQQQHQKKLDELMSKGMSIAGVRSWKPKVILHTGFWGCGSFGGNKRVMAYLQMLAASAAGVDELLVHYNPKAAGELDDIETAKRWFKEDVIGFEQERGGLIQSVVSLTTGGRKEVVELAPGFKSLKVEELFEKLAARNETWENAL